MYRERQLRNLKDSFLDAYLDKHHIRCSRTRLKRDKVDIVAAHLTRSLVNADMLNDEKDDAEGEESDDEYENDVVLEDILAKGVATDTGQKSDPDQDYDESYNESDVDNDHEDDETMIRTTMRKMTSATIRIYNYKSVAPCVLPNLVKHACKVSLILIKV